MSTTLVLRDPEHLVDHTSGTFPSLWFPNAVTPRQMKWQISEISGIMCDVQSPGRLPVCLTHGKTLRLQGRDSRVPLRPLLLVFPGALVSRTRFSRLYRPSALIFLPSLFWALPPSSLPPHSPSLPRVWHLPTDIKRAGVVGLLLPNCWQ